MSRVRTDDRSYLPSDSEHTALHASVSRCADKCIPSPFPHRFRVQRRIEELSTELCQLTYPCISNQRGPFVSRIPNKFSLRFLDGCTLLLVVASHQRWIPNWRVSNTAMTHRPCCNSVIWPLAIGPAHPFRTKVSSVPGLSSTKLWMRGKLVLITVQRSILQVVDLQCSPAVPCPNMIFHDLEVTPPTGQGLSFVCKNVVNESGLPGKCCSIFGQAWHYVEHGWWIIIIGPCNSTGKP